ncbi:MAG: type II secretion system F family protein [Desulfobacteraceae bacterium]|nr:type II secretion system F family protein [Desulfobacteraceae bacterium]
MLRIEDEYDRYRETAFDLFNRIRPAVEILAAYNSKLKLEKYEEKVKQKLIKSGNLLQLIPMEFLAIKEIAAVCGCLIGIYLVVMINAAPFFIVLCGIIAFFLPDLKINGVTQKRKRSIFIDLPFCMDLLTLAVEAGMNFSSGLNEVVEKGKAGPLRDELDKLLQEMRLGVSQKEALGAFAGRIDLYEIRSFISAINQSEKLGTPLGETLRVQSDIRRNERYQRAEKMAQEAPIKMLGPLALFIFPAVFIVIFLPIILKINTGGF